MTLMNRLNTINIQPTVINRNLYPPSIYKTEPTAGPIALPTPSANWIYPMSCYV